MRRGSSVALAISIAFSAGVAMAQPRPKVIYEPIVLTGQPIPAPMSGTFNSFPYHSVINDANKIVWLAPSPANNTWGIAVRKDVADENKLTNLSEFGKYISGGGKVILAASSEFVNSAAALPAFQTAYSFTLKPDQLITLSGGDTAATIAAAANQTNGANAAMVYGTDGGIAPSGLVVLEDDKHVQPVYQPAPIIREEVLKKNPKIEELLKPVFAKLDLTTLQELNGRVQLGGEPAKAVAEEFLKTNGFLK